MTWNEKISLLKLNLSRMGSVMVAFSGGKDSYFLLKSAIDTLGKENTRAIFIHSMFTSQLDIQRVEYFEKFLKITIRKHQIEGEYQKEILQNQRDRCYFCKKKIFSFLLQETSDLGVLHLLDGTTLSDLDEYRPGLQALEEMKVLSPLKDAGITSSEIIRHLKGKIEPYYLTSSTCLATRFPYDINLTAEMIQTFDKIETFLVHNDIFPVKVRYIPDGIRIETDPANFTQLMKKRDPIIAACQSLGITFMTLDLEGIKSGVWD